MEIYSELNLWRSLGVFGVFCVLINYYLMFFRDESKVECSFSSNNSSMRIHVSLQTEGLDVYTIAKTSLIQRQNISHIGEKLKNSVDWNAKIHFRIRNFDYPFNGNIKNLMIERKNGNPSFPEINPYRYKFLILPRRFCERHIHILFLVKSADVRLPRRNVIRTLWGSVYDVEGLHLQYVFVVARSRDVSEPPGKEIQLALVTESELHGDILQIDAVDNYYNNTLKIRGAMKWVVEHCAGFPSYVMFVDDDFYVNPYLLASFAKQFPSKFSTSLYLGMVHVTTPARDKRDKWYISNETYPYAAYPPFLRAGAMLMSYDVVKGVHYASYYVKNFIFDDVYIGIVAFKLGIVPRDCKMFFVSRIEPYHADLCQTLVSHGYSIVQLQTTWLYSQKKCK